MAGRPSFIAALALCAIATPAFALPCPESVDHGPQVACGSDYFQTVPGGSSDVIPGFGLVDFNGVPFLLGNNTDTIVQRTRDIAIGGSPGPLLLTALQLKSTNLITPIFVSLDPANLANDTGTITINGTLAGGTFSSTLNVFFDICTAVGVNGVGCGLGSSLGTGSLVLPNSSSTWLPTEAVVDQLFRGPDNGSAADQAANKHTGLDELEVDFFPGVVHTGPHPVDPAAAPEPGTLALLGTGLLGLAGLWYRGRQQ